MRNSVERNRRWLAWFLEAAQQSEEERPDDVAQVLYAFAKAQAPRLEVDWDTEPGGPPLEQPKAMMWHPPRKTKRQRHRKVCVQCGRPGVYRSETADATTKGPWYCVQHEADARA